MIKHKGLNYEEFCEHVETLDGPELEQLFDIMFTEFKDLEKQLEDTTISMKEFFLLLNKRDRHKKFLQLLL